METSTDKGVNKTSTSKCSEPGIHLLGEIVILFGNLEFALGLSICQLLAPEGNKELFVKSQAITEALPFKRKATAFASLFHQKGATHAGRDLKDLLQRLQRAEDERNQLMHSAWTYSPLWGGQDLMRIKGAHRRNKGFMHGIHRMPLERIEEVRHRIEVAFQSLASFTTKYIQASKLEDEENQTD